MNSVTLTGIVIKETDVGEYDRRLVILTRERGKVVAFARGAKRMKNQMSTGARLFAFGEYELFEGKDAYNLVKADIKNSFYEISNDMEAACYGCYFLELADYYSRENVDSSETIKLIYQSLRALMNDKINNRLVKCIYELKMLTINGEYPNMFECIGCKSEHPKYFSAIRGGMFCDSCSTKKSISDGVNLNESTVYTMKFIICSPIEKLYTFVLKQNILEELEFAMKRYMNVHVEKEFNSLKILESIVI